LQYVVKLIQLMLVVMLLKSQSLSQRAKKVKKTGAFFLLRLLRRILIWKPIG